MREKRAELEVQGPGGGQDGDEGVGEGPEEMTRGRTRERV